MKNIQARRTEEVLSKVLSGVRFGEIEPDGKPTSHQDGKPTSHYIYSLKNTQKSRGESSQQGKLKTLFFQDTNLKHGFAQIPNVVLRDPLLSGNEKTLYALLLSYAWQDNECFPGQDLLASNMGLTRRSITQLLTSLKKRKLIGWKRQGQGKVNIYHIRKLSDAFPSFIDKGKIV